MEIPAPLVLIAPFIVTPLAAWLGHDQFPRWLNAAIALAVVLITAFAWSLLSNSLAGNVITDMVLIAGYCAALMAGPLQPLYEWLTVKLTSPLTAIADAMRPVIYVATATPPATVRPPSTPLVPTPMTSITSQATTPLPASQPSSPGTTWMASALTPPDPPHADQAQTNVTSSSPVVETPAPPLPVTHDE